MKKIFVLVSLFVLSFSAAAFEKPASHFCAPNSTTISCQLELALVCGPNYEDGCLTGQTSAHKCVLQVSGELCREPISLLCIAGLKDGCVTGRTSRHQCVPYVGPSCDSGQEFSCPTGFTDTCAK